MSSCIAHAVVPGLEISSGAYPDVWVSGDNYLTIEAKYTFNARLLRLCVLLQDMNLVRLTARQVDPETEMHASMTRTVALSGVKPAQDPAEHWFVVMVKPRMHNHVARKRVCTVLTSVSSTGRHGCTVLPRFVFEV